MCRYAGKTYKSHYACFKCRKSFKQADSSDILAACQKTLIEECPGKNNEIKYWSDNIQKIKTEIIGNRFEITV